MGHPAVPQQPAGLLPVVLLQGLWIKRLIYLNVMTAALAAAGWLL